MATLFKLVLCSTYASAAGIFTAGRTYTEDQLTTALNDTDDRGQRFFVPVQDDQEVTEDQEVPGDQEVLEEIGIGSPAQEAQDTQAQRKKGITIRRSEQSGPEVVTI